MGIRNKKYIPKREPVSVIDADPELGLKTEQAELRRVCGWSNDAPDGAGRRRGQIRAQSD